MSYVLMALAGLWMADGIALLVAPLRVIALLKESLEASPSILNWSGISAVLGVLLIFQIGGLPYHPLWLVTGLVMIAKGLFFFFASHESRYQVVTWLVNREAVDYRFWGLGLCTLSILLLDAVGAI